MNTIYSIISFKSSQITDEKISIGLIMFNETGIYCKFSKAKIKFAHKISPETANVLSTKVEAIKKNFIEKNQNDLFKTTVDITFIEYLNQYEQELLHFSRPNLITQQLDKAMVDFYFSRWIEPIPVKKEMPLKSAKFQSVIENKLVKQLKSNIDTDYKIEKEKIPGLINDFKISSIGANGYLFASNSLDLVNIKTESHISNKIFEFESFLDRVIPFSEEKLNLKHERDNIILFINKPSSGSENESIYHNLQEQNNLSYLRLPYKICEVDVISDYVDRVKSSGASKFSEKLEAIQ